jgi:ABC-type Na+ efflux pump permease subunit
MRKIWWVARREFVAAVVTKGFIIGVLILPLTVALLVLVLPAVVNKQAPRIEGTVAVADAGGEVLPLVARELSAEVLARQRVRINSRVRRAVEGALPASMRAGPAGAAHKAIVDQAMREALSEIPTLRVVPAEPAQVDAWKTGLAAVRRHDSPPRPSDRERPPDLLAIVTVHAHAVRSSEGAYGAYDLLVPPRLDERLQREIRDALKRAIIEARVRAAGLDPQEVASLTEVAGASTRIVTAGGDRASNDVLHRLIPAAFMALLLMSVLSSGSQLMTNTVEDKSSRVVELLLSAISPLELMTGKILAQMGVGMVMLGIYAAMGLAALASFAVLDVIDPSMLLFLVLFYVLGYSLLAALMGAIGAAVDDVSEASSLLTPVMLVMMVPWLLWLPISRNPDGALSVTLSFIPPISLYTMLLRMTSTSPPPSWQVWLCVLEAILAAVGALWFAGKVFRIGLLMHGRPPDLKTLVRWMKMA